jgi:tRNA (cmo5U34)-methyltransferase
MSRPTVTSASDNRRMGVAAHLGIDLAEYDARIRSFIPDYEEMLDTAAAAVPRNARVIVDLGTGTGALASRCLRQAPRARVAGIDADPAILAIAARRLGARATFTRESFLRADLPRCDAAVASLALHHIRTRAAKRRLFRRLRRAVRSGGPLVIVDCYPSSERSVARSQREAWIAHLRRSYSSRRAEQLLQEWSHEDVYQPLEVEGALLRDAGFRSDVLWRKGAFAVLIGL